MALILSSEDVIYFFIARGFTRDQALHTLQYADKFMSAKFGRWTFESTISFPNGDSAYIMIVR